MTIRDAAPADLDALLALERACYPPAEAYARSEYRSLLDARRAVSLVDEEGTILLGFASATRAGHVVTVNVQPHARRRGVGTRLLRELERRLAALGARRVALEVNVANAPAIRMYETLGYRRMGRLSAYYSGYEEPDAWAYAKELDNGGAPEGLSGAAARPFSA